MAHQVRRISRKPDRSGMVVLIRLGGIVRLVHFPLLRKWDCVAPNFSRSRILRLGLKAHPLLIMAKRQLERGDGMQMQRTPCDKFAASAYG